MAKNCFSSPAQLTVRHLVGFSFVFDWYSNEVCLLWKFEDKNYKVLFSEVRQVFLYSELYTSYRNFQTARLFTDHDNYKQWEVTKATPGFLCIIFHKEKQEKWSGEICLSFSSLKNISTQLSLRKSRFFRQNKKSYFEPTWIFVASSSSLFEALTRNIKNLLAPDVFHIPASFTTVNDITSVFNYYKSCLNVIWCVTYDRSEVMNLYLLTFSFVNKENFRPLILCCLFQKVYQDTWAP